METEPNPRHSLPRGVKDRMIFVEIEKQKSFIVKCAYWILVGGIIFVLLKYCVPTLMPFVIGGLVAVVLRPLSEWLSRKTKANRKVMAALILIIFYGAVGILLVLSGAKVFLAVKEFVLTVPNYYVNELEPALLRIFNELSSFIMELDPSLQATVQSVANNLISTLADLVKNFSVAAVDYITSFAGFLPGFLLRFLFAIVSSFFISVDFPRIKDFIARQITPRQRQMLRMVRENAFGTMGQYVKAYAIIMCITFVELTIGFFIIGLNNAAVIALSIAIFDVLPVLGTGGVMVPWVLISLIVGDTALAIKLAVIYVIVTAVRNVLEPKIVGKQIGLHPLVTLMAMYVGTVLFGVVGLLGLPISITILKNLNDNGTIRWLK